MAGPVQPEKIHEDDLEVYYDAHKTKNGMSYRLKPRYAHMFPRPPETFRATQRKVLVLCEHGSSHVNIQNSDEREPNVIPDGSSTISVAPAQPSTASSPSIHGTRTVSCLRVVVHQSEEHQNHWSLFLLISDDESVRINMMTPDPTYVNGELQISDHNYVSSNSEIKHWDFSVVQSTTVDEFLTLLYQNGRDLYNMSGGGSGCRYWT
jgi:hypothetical protein